MRTYGDPCGIARALDLIGERWALLVVRELLLGPKRFSDLRTGLPQLSANVLSQRLSELDAAGIVAHRQLDPPAATQVYELTEWGSDLEPVLLELGRWGSRSPARLDAELSNDALMIALQTTYAPPANADQLPLTVGVVVGRNTFTLTATPDILTVKRGTHPDCDATLTADGPTLRSLTFGGRPVDDAIAAGDVDIDGSTATVSRFLSCFERPEPIQPT